MHNMLLLPGVRLMRHFGLFGKFFLLMMVNGLPCLLWILSKTNAFQWVSIGAGSSYLAYLMAMIWCMGTYLVVSLYVSLSEDLVALQLSAEKLAHGDLRLTSKLNGIDELAKLMQEIIKIAGNLSSIVANVRSGAAYVAFSGGSIARGNHALSERTEQQASNLEETSASVDELSTTVKESTSRADVATEQATRLRKVADASAGAMEQAILSVDQIQQSTKKMDDIVSVIDGIAFQTNILALNAAVEAARAGESGRGFAVVASEVRSLAQRSAASAKEIRVLISASSEYVDSGVKHIRAVGQNIEQVVEGIRQVESNMKVVASSSALQSASLSEIRSTMHQLDTITQSNATMVEHAVGQSDVLEERASALDSLVDMFQLQQGSPAEALQLVQKAIASYKQLGSDEQFLQNITRSAQQFSDRDMYVFALDRQGHYLAFAGNVSKVGSRVQDIPGVDGVRLVAAIFAQAETEPGWVEYAITNPSTGTVQTKMSYVTMLNDMAIGCGVYKNFVGL
ncbi:methyl-accepting chemotaxis protein [Undibacterium sp. Ji22W]|uniref:methyl-accepting chemotaxis protein n=1 Tax=Undibacterium sp. Ji22W TaxID=3413038 RepID=UPI003BF0AE59